MNPFDAISTALTAISANKLRSVLTILGIVIGVGAVIAVMAIGSGSKQAITSQIESIGTNLIFVNPSFAVQQGGVRGAQGSGVTLKLDDAQALADPTQAPSVSLVSPEVTARAQIVAAGQNVNTRVVGVTPEYQTIRNYVVADGEFITNQDVTSRSLVIVLGANVANNLFGANEPVGETVLVNQRRFQVIGVLASKGGTGLGSQDDLAIAPITTVQTRIFAQRNSQGSTIVNSINVQATSSNTMDSAKQEISQILRDRHNKLPGEEDFTVTSQDDLLSARTQVTNVLTIFLGSIAGISLLVGGIGIMNIMLVSVTERTREIGLRKAVGAKRRDILAQFLLEAAILSITGGALGIVGGWGASKLLSGITLSNQSVTTVVTPSIVALSVLVSIAIGVFFGLYPAARASRLDPITALRYE